MPRTKIDAIDRRILDRLQDNARISNVELAREVGLSPSPCLRRVRDLEESGVIRRYAALVEPTRVGLGINVYVQITLEKQAEEALELFEEAIVKRPEVMECNLITGDADYLLRVAVADLEDFEKFLRDHLTRIPMVGSIKSSFVLKEVSSRTALPLAPNSPPE